MGLGFVLLPIQWVGVEDLGGWLKEIILFLLFLRDWYLGVAEFEGGYEGAVRLYSQDL